MNRLSWPQAVPVSFSFPQSEGLAEGWGRLTRLSSKTGSLLSLGKIPIGARMILDFEIGGESFHFNSRVLAAARGRSGYVTAHLFFVKASDRKRLAVFLLDLIARSS